MMTPIERSLGRFMRAPDHGDAGGDQGGSGDNAGAGDQGASDAGTSGDGGDAGDDGESTALGDAGDEGASGDGAGGDGSDDKAEKDGGEAGDDETGAPEKYELKLTVTEKDAEGKDVETQVDMDPVLVEKAEPLLRELNLTNDQANKLVGLVPQIQARLAEQQNDQFATMRADWAKEAKADEEIGGKNWTPSLNLAAKALDRLGAPKGSAFRGLLDETGLGNHKEMVRIFAKVGKLISEDTSLERGDHKGKTKPDKLAEQYPDDVPKTN